MEVGLFVGTEKPLNKSSSAAEFKAQKYYESCMDVNKTIEKLGAQPAKEFLSGIGSWPELNETKNFDIQSLVEKIKAYGIGVLFNYWVGVDDKNSTVNILQVCCILICRYLYVNPMQQVNDFVHIPIIWYVDHHLMSNQHLMNIKQELLTLMICQSKGQGNYKVFNLIDFEAITL